MIRSGNSARFTPTEVEEFRQIGLDLGDVRHQNDIEQEVSRWAHTLADDRFDLLKKIASEMAKAKGLKLPPKVAIVPSLDSSPQSRLASAARLPTSGNEIRSLSSRRHAE
jgi:murein DD-endopeptidase MepM/ murein hydrolase activator NlpD